MDDLINFGSVTPQAAQFLAACVKGKLNVLISGGTGTGKTTMLNALSAFVPGRRADRHDRGRGRAPAPAGARDHARVAPAEHRGQGRDPHPRARPQRPAHAPRPDHRRRGPRRRDARHAPGDEHGPRGLADHDPRELAPRRALPARDARAHRRRRPAAAGDPRADLERVRPARPDLPPRRRLAPRHAHHRGAADGVRRDHAPGPLPREAAGRGQRRQHAGRAPALAALLHGPEAALPREDGRQRRRSCRRPSSTWTPPAGGPRSPQRPTEAGRDAQGFRRTLRARGDRTGHLGGRRAAHLRGRRQCVSRGAGDARDAPAGRTRPEADRERPARGRLRGREPRPRQEHRRRRRPFAVHAGAGTRRRLRRRPRVHPLEAAQRPRRRGRRGRAGGPADRLLLVPDRRRRRAQDDVGRRRSRNGVVRRGRPLGAGPCGRRARSPRARPPHRRSGGDERSEPQGGDRGRPRRGCCRLSDRDREPELLAAPAQAAREGDGRALLRRRRARARCTGSTPRSRRSCAARGGSAT